VGASQHLSLLTTPTPHHFTTAGGDTASLHSSLLLGDHASVAQTDGAPAAPPPRRAAAPLLPRLPATSALPPGRCRQALPRRQSPWPIAKAAVTLDPALGGPRPGARKAPVPGPGSAEGVPVRKVTANARGGGTSQHASAEGRPAEL
jgi:hypothetical protein